LAAKAAAAGFNDDIYEDDDIVRNNSTLCFELCLFGYLFRLKKITKTNNRCL